jgi:hypothetical protein
MRDITYLVFLIAMGISKILLDIAVTGVIRLSVLTKEFEEY